MIAKKSKFLTVDDWNSWKKLFIAEYEDELELDFSLSLFSLVVIILSLISLKVSPVQSTKSCVSFL